MAMTLELSDQPMHPIFIPWCAGASRHERLVQKHVPDSDPGWMVPASRPFVSNHAGVRWNPLALVIPTKVAGIQGRCGLWQ